SISHILHIHFHLLSHPPATTPIYTLSLHDALPISSVSCVSSSSPTRPCRSWRPPLDNSTRSRNLNAWKFVMTIFARFTSSSMSLDRKSTRLNSSHVAISYAVFCLKKKNNKRTTRQ